LLQIHREVLSLAVFQDRAEGAVVDFHRVEELDDVRVAEPRVNVVLANGVFDVVSFRVLGPIGVELVDLDRHLAEGHEVVALVDLAEAASAEQAEKLILVVQTWQLQLAASVSATNNSKEFGRKYFSSSETRFIV